MFKTRHLFQSVILGSLNVRFWGLFFSSLKFDWQTLSGQEQFRALGQDENVEPNGAPFFGRKREPLMEEVGTSIRPYLVKKRRVLLLYYVKLCV